MTPHTAAFHSDVPIVITAGFVVVSNRTSTLCLRELTVTRQGFHFVWEASSSIPIEGSVGWSNVRFEVRTDCGTCTQTCSGVESASGLAAIAGLIAGPRTLTLPTSLAPVPASGNVEFSARWPDHGLPESARIVSAARFQEAAQNVVSISDAPVGRAI
jgi:hypothetical protein